MTQLARTPTFTGKRERKERRRERGGEREGFVGDISARTWPNRSLQKNRLEEDRTLCKRGGVGGGYVDLILQIGRASCRERVSSPV